MTTKHSPLSKLKAQADKMAMLLKQMERGEKVMLADVHGKLANARNQTSIKFALVMDDKVLSITMEWTTVRKMSEVAIAEFLLNQMREHRETSH